MRWVLRLGLACEMGRRDEDDAREERLGNVEGKTDVLEQMQSYRNQYGIQE